MKYRKKVNTLSRPAEPKTHDWVLGMLYIVQLRLRRRDTGEKIKHRILMVGCEANDLERKLKWSFDMKVYDEFAITDIQKVKDKIHILSSVIEQDHSPAQATIERNEGTQEFPYPPQEIERYDPKVFAVGLATMVRARDGDHALRKVGRALINSTDGHSHAGAALSENSTLTIEEIPKPSGYAMPRDVTNEVNEPRFFRG